jgi:DNA invertase Pin-like site-specific DNA recombinase
LRVSTDEQTTENQRQELQRIATLHKWDIVAIYEDAGISGAKGRDERPQLDFMLREAMRRRFDVLAVWSVDRLGRSLRDLLETLSELQSAGVNLYLHQQGIDTRTPGGRAMFQMMGVFAEFERALIQERVTAGQKRARAEGKQWGGSQQRVPVEDRRKIRAKLKMGVTPTVLADTYGVSRATIYRIRDEED